jgi:hypothetical protein
MNKDRMFYCKYPGWKDDKFKPWNPEPSKDTTPWSPEPREKKEFPKDRKFPWDEIPEMPVRPVKREFDDLTTSQLEALEKECAGREEYEKCARIRDEIKRRKSC